MHINPHISHTTNSIAARNERFKQLVEHEYTDDEIKKYNIVDEINDHPLARRPINTRSKLAYQALMTNLDPTKKYLLPGQIAIFNYANPLHEAELEYYDATPFTLFLGITRTKDNKIREIGLNLHYYPPFTRRKILQETYTIFKHYFNKYFNESSEKPNTFISYDVLKRVMRQNQKIGFGIKMYVPSLRGQTWLIPTRLLPTAFYTEGHFSKATLQQIFMFWRKFRQLM